MEKPPGISDIIDIHKNISSFCRDAAEINDFEKFVYVSPLLEAILGSDLYLETISTDFSKQSSVAKLKKSLNRWLASSPTLPSIEQASTIQQSCDLRLAQLKVEIENIKKSNYSGSPTIVPSLPGSSITSYQILSPKINSIFAGLGRRNVVVYKPWQKSWLFKDGNYTPKTSG